MRLSILLLAVVSSSIIFQSSAQQFPCDGKLYFFRNYAGVNWLSYIDQYTTATPVVANVCQIDASITGINAMGANPIDHLIYFTANSNNGTLFQLNSNCTFAGWCLNIPNTDMGCFDNLGRYWIISGTTFEAYDINSCTRVKGPFTITPLSGSADIAFSVADCHFYMASSSSVIEIDTNGVKVNTYATGFGGTGTFGGLAIGSDGNIYGMPDVTATGSLYEFNVTTHTGRLVTSFASGTANPCGCDMASFPCPTLNSNFTASASSACASSPTIQFTNTSEGLVNTFAWDFGDGTTDTINTNPAHTYTSPGIYTVKLSVSALVRCLYVAPSTFSMNVQIFPSPVAAINGDSVICNGASTALSASGGLRYLWNTGDTVNSITVAPATTTPYSVTVTDGNGCTSGSSINVAVNPLPTVTASAQGNTAICQGGSVQICTNGTFNSYIWSGGGQTTQCIEATSTAQYAVTATDVNGCSATSNSVSVTVGLTPAIIINAGRPTSFCLGDSVMLTASGADSGYVWAPTGETTASIIAKANSTYSVTGINRNGCTSVSTQVITVNPLPAISFAPFISPVCVTDAPYILTGGSPAGGAYSGTGVSGNTFNPASAGTGTYVITYSYSDAVGCSNSASVSITVNPAGTVSIAPIPELCSIASAYTLTGTPPGGTFSGTGVTGNTFDPSVAGAGTYTITYTNTNTNGCISGSTASTTVTVYNSPVVTISGSPTIPCHDNTIYLGYGPQFVTLTANSGNPVSSYQWYLNGVAIRGATLDSIQVNTNGNYNVVITDVSGCTSDSANTSVFTLNVVDIRCGQNLKKVVLCHVPPGNPGNPQSLCIAPEAVAAHLAGHPGDCLGPCPNSKHRMTESETENGNDNPPVLNILPNPFSDKTTIVFAVPQGGHAVLGLYDMKGALVSALFDGEVTGGVQYQFIVDGSNLTDGIYISRLTSDSEVIHKKMILAR